MAREHILLISYDFDVIVVLLTHDTGYWAINILWPGHMSASSHDQ